MGAQDFNYKVALASGLKSLQANRLRQAEEQFRYLVAHFPRADGGYRGLAKIFVEQEDRPAALRTLLDGAANLAKGGERTAAIGILREAVMLEPQDLAAHRRLGAALALAGDVDGAAGEYSRFVQLSLEHGEGERARLEAAYALAQFGSSPALSELATWIGPTPGAPLPAAATAGDSAARDAMLGAAFASTPPETAAAEPRAALFDATPSPAAPPAEAATFVPAPAHLPATDGAGDEAIEAATARYLAAGDPRAGDAALDAARRYLAAGRTAAASDLLLQLIASGIAPHDAQRLLVEVARSIGKREVARVKCELLARALLLEGREDLAAEVQALAQAD